MADKLHFDLVSPERRLFAGEVDMVVVPGEDGDFGVLPKHAPFMSVIRSGAIIVTTDGVAERTFIHGGFAEVTPEGLTILAEEAIPVSEIDVAALEQDLKNAQEDLGVAKSEMEVEQAQGRIERLEAMRTTVAN
ncbi:F0F1 ATP synthase subunit epsilon [Maricaulis salignorans]|uniref:ATP synthase epsilon chain n=1 Tax=Maricaulis salignorans TaxID=144026 RepID=A0A1G9LL62_9PROT|nr:F0F1 ATP synthase subunit epsilon [Maricaulis salignorans]SDL62749.1 ATP synthase F1 subcomplex epsilon subunit [Maricaulis salignorans]